MSKHKQVVAGVLGLMVACGAVAATVYALSASSASYQLVETVAAGKGFASSTSYRSYGSAGQPTPVGVTQSASYKAEVGFLRRAALISGGAVPVPTLIDPDGTNDGLVRIGDILLAVNNYYKEITPSWNPEADYTGDGMGRVDDILVAVADYYKDNWPPFNSSLQPVTVAMGGTVRFYVVAPKDANDVLPTLAVVGGVPGQSFTVDAGEVNGKRRGFYQWVPSSAQPTTQVIFRATYGSSSSEVSVWIRSQ